MMTTDPGDRFWSKVNKTDGCWLWVASVKPAGYGQFRLNGTTAYAHRIAYELLIGPIPEGFDIDHLCRTPRCVRPDHLEAVTHQENMRRGHFGRKTHCPRGHRYDQANTRISRGRKPGRHCRACAAIDAKLRWASRAQRQAS